MIIMVINYNKLFYPTVLQMTENGLEESLVAMVLA